MKRILALLVPILLTSACARFSTTQKEYRYDIATGKLSGEITTRAASTTFFDSKSALTKWKATQSEKTQGAEVGGLSQESTATNIVTLTGTASEMLKLLAK